MISLKNKILLSIVILITIFILIVRFVFNKNFEEFKEDILLYEQALLNDFEEKKNTKLNYLKSNMPQVYQKFMDKFNNGYSKVMKDSSYHFLYLEESIQYNFISIKYLECLERVCVLEIENDKVAAKIKIKVKKFESEFGEYFLEWYKDEQIRNELIKVSNEFSCKEFLLSEKKIEINDEAWVEFSRFLSQYKRDVNNANYQNLKQKKKLDLEINKLRKKLNSNADIFLDQKLKISNVITNNYKNKVFNSDIFVEVNYKILEKEFKQEEFDKVKELALIEQYKTNSLNTGAVPYSYCYGSYNSCSGYSCSQIEVKAGGSDAVVTIKRNGDVYRHAYIKSYGSYVFDVSDGTYNVYFYSGKGWNPNKFIKYANCGKVKGGFVSSESVIKKENLALYGNIWTVTLYTVIDGNFRPASSNKSEAF